MTTSDEHIPDTEYKRGDHIKYRRGEHTCTGKIVWIFSPSQLMGQLPPTGYIVERDGDSSSIPDKVSPADIISKEKRAISMTTLDEQFEDLYGPLPQYSDFKKGERIIYTQGGKTYTGKIVWVAATEPIAIVEHPLCYIVECDQVSGIPHSVPLGDIVVDPRR